MSSSVSIEIGDRRVGEGHPCFLIAEAGVNHNGSLEYALELVDCAVDAGADAVKFQTFQANRLATAQAKQANYQRHNMGQDLSQLQMLAQLELSFEDHQALIQRCRKRGIMFLSTPFDHKSAEVLVHLQVPVLKIASGEITNLPFLEHVAQFNRPLIVSTGMSRLGEVEQAVQAIQRTGNHNFALLHCVSNYPAKAADVNLRAMQTMRTAFGQPVGYSDHTLGIDVGIASVALGACILEKHFTLDRTLPGPDHCASLEPSELRQLVQGVRTVEAALGDGKKQPAACELNTADAARKSLVAATSIPAGTPLTEDLIAIKRPGTGLPPILKPQLLNRRTTVDLPRGHLLTWEDVA
ncbi:MAG: N-acetylneuraminate synthase [Pirellulales bacterium]|nr:N-acetylneuraminate synthase [Pirellulales bacterium]